MGGTGSYVLMPRARTTLEALISNDPEHPAIPLFVVSLQVTLALPCDDSTKIEAIKHLVENLEKRLQT